VYKHEKHLKQCDWINKQNITWKDNNCNYGHQPLSASKTRYCCEFERWI